jgi:hypothetical protein
MDNILERQTFVISVNLATLNDATHPSQVTLPMNLRFAADELILKSICYNSLAANADIPDSVQIWCNITNDNLIGAFANSPSNLGDPSPVNQMFNSHFRINNTFQTGNFVLQFQNTSLGAPASYNPQSLISSTTQHTFGTVVLTIEFVKHSK